MQETLASPSSARAAANRKLATTLHLNWALRDAAGSRSMIRYQEGLIAMAITPRMVAWIEAEKTAGAHLNERSTEVEVKIPVLLVDDGPNIATAKLLLRRAFLSVILWVGLGQILMGTAVRTPFGFGVGMTLSFAVYGLFMPPRPV